MHGQFHDSAWLPLVLKEEPIRYTHRDHDPSSEISQSKSRRDTERSMHRNLTMKYDSEEEKHKKYWKIPEFQPVKREKRENIGRMKSTGEPVSVKWIWKMVSVVQKNIIIFRIYFVFKIVTVTAVKALNQKGER